MLTNFQFVQKIANQLIRPRPCNYAALDIWQNISTKDLYKYENPRFNLNNQRFVNLHMIERKVDQNAQNQIASTCIVYLHGFSSFCTQGNFLIQKLQKQFKTMNVSVCLYDLRGHGKDKGQNVTFGLEESKQLCEILIYLKKQRHYENFILWGRSMGATTILKMLNDHKAKIDSQKICIKHLILDSGFSSFQKAAREIISKRSGMPMIFSKPIFQCLLSAIEKQHKLKLVVELDKLNLINTPAVFLYSENDDLICAEHTKFIYEQYSGMKHKIQIHVGHNQSRPQSIMKQVFSMLRKSLQQQQKNLLKKRSMSCKKIGLSVTKNHKRVKTIQTFFDDEEDIPISLQNKFKQLIKTPKNKELKIKKAQSKFTPVKESENITINQNSIKISPRPLKISQSGSYFQKKTKKQLPQKQINQFESICHEKENFNTLNIQKNDFHHKKDQKLKLSHRDLIKDLSTENLNLFKNTTNIKEKDPSIHIQNCQTKKVQNQQSFEKLYSPYEFGLRKQGQSTSIFISKSPIRQDRIMKDTYFIEQQQVTFHDLKDIRIITTQKISQNKIKLLQKSKKVSQNNSNEQQLINKKLQHHQSSEKLNLIDFRKTQCPVPKPQTENIHHLKSKNSSIIPEHMYLRISQKQNSAYQGRKIVPNNIRNTIKQEALKNETRKRKNAVIYNQYCTFDTKKQENKNILQMNNILYVSNAQHVRTLSNRNYF